jgi:hypothetical protein
MDDRISALIFKEINLGEQKLEEILINLLKIQSLVLYIKMKGEGIGIL